MADPVIVGASVVAGIGGTGFATWFLKRLDAKKQDISVCEERTANKRARILQIEEKLKSNDARDSLTAQEMVSMKLLLNDISNKVDFMHEKIKNGGNR